MMGRSGPGWAYYDGFPTVLIQPVFYVGGCYEVMRHNNNKILILGLALNV
jgi:hypothetical protein